MSYTMMNGNVVLLSYKTMMDASNKKIINDVDKVREIKKAIVQLLVAKKNSMEIEERMKFLSIDEKLYLWINNTSIGDITNTVYDALRILKSYNKFITI